MRRLIELLFPRLRAEQSAIAEINKLRAQWSDASDSQLRDTCRSSADLNQHALNEVIAATAVAAHRELGLEMFDVQLHGALALANGRIAQMQTGEGKTLAAVPAVIWLAKAGRGVHVMTVNDYLARRDAQWMGGIYRRLGFSVGCIQQGMAAADRQ